MLRATAPATEIARLGDVLRALAASDAEGFDALFAPVAPRLQVAGAHAKEKFRNRQIACRRHAYEHGIDAPDITGWRWPISK